MQPLEVLCKKKVLLNISQNSLENTCDRVSFFNKVEGVVCIKKETLTQVFFCQFCEMFKNNYFVKHVRTTAFVSININLSYHQRLSS